VAALRAEGIRAGLFRPQTLWPFPVAALLPILARTRRVLVAEASEGQLEDELRLALHRANAPAVELAHVRRYGGVLPSEREIVQAARALARREVAA
jgi:pyruvate/2-oxoacid:ferredoxin oxidoreductase alpha subunit